MAQITLGQLLHTNGNEPLGTTNGALNVALTGSSVTAATTLFDAFSTPGTHRSAFIPCSGMNRAIALFQISPDFKGDFGLEGRADTDVVSLPMYIINTALGMQYTSLPGYYEADINPLASIRARVFIETGSITVRVWLSATPFAPDLPGAEIAIFNALAIRSTANNAGARFSGTCIRRARLYVDSSLDQPVTLTAVNAANGAWLRDSNGSALQLVVPANRREGIYMSDDWPILGGPWPDRVRIDAQCATPPTTGSLTVKLIAESM